jgi:threonyl-tRNA synthetase
MRAAEIGLVHRHEMSGVLNGLFRVRAFHQDDAHMFMTPDQIQGEILDLLRLEERMYSHLRPWISSGAVHPAGEVHRHRRTVGNSHQRFGIGAGCLRKGIRDQRGRWGLLRAQNRFHIKDALGRTWQCGTIQLDMSLPERFDLHYIGQDNERHRPIMVHRTVFGSIERFLGILTEHFAGRFPLWLAPVQVTLLPINDENSPAAACASRWTTAPKASIERSVTPS